MNTPGRLQADRRPAVSHTRTVGKAAGRAGVVSACLVLFELACVSLPELRRTGGPIVSPDPVGAPVAFYRGTMRPGCAPSDAPSVELRLEADSGSETAFFNLWPRTPVWPPTTVRFDAAHPDGAASYCSAGGACEPAEWGVVGFNSSGDRASVTGEWSIGLPGGRSRHGTFEVEWLAIQAYCG